MLLMTIAGGVVAGLFAFVVIVALIVMALNAAPTQQQRLAEHRRHVEARERAKQYRQEHAVRPVIAWSVIIVSTVLIFTVLVNLTSST